MFYRGPNGAQFELHEGAFCGDADGCVPGGSDAGSAAFGDQSGTLVTGDDGRYAVVVDRGDDISWLAIGDGLDVEVFKDFAAALVRVERVAPGSRRVSPERPPSPVRPPPGPPPRRPSSRYRPRPWS